MNITVSNIEKILQTKRTGDFDGIVDHISIDSRSLQNNQKTLFFAIIGPNNDGHNYIGALIDQGVRFFVVSSLPKNDHSEVSFLLVENTLTALQKFAIQHRSQHNFPVIGITGSNGKTIVKEWLNFLLSPDFNIVRSPKSYNSQVGVPLSVLAMNEHYNLGIFEAGISQINEMENLEKIIQPNIGILTNIGSAHDEGFENLDEKTKEKLKLFKNCEILICQKNKRIEDLLETNVKTLTWSYTDQTADAIILRQSTDTMTAVEASYHHKLIRVDIPFVDEASIENAICCLMVLLHLNYEFSNIQNRMTQLYPVEMRLKIKKGINNTTLIDDSYSSDFESLKIALDFLESQKQYSSKAVIISDIFQSGLSSEELYSKVAQLIISNKINRVIGIGETVSAIKGKVKNCVIFNQTADFLLQLNDLNFQNETILIKGSRQFKFEEIVFALEEQTHETVLEINLNAISHNLSFYKSKLGPKTQIMVMVKAFGYGSGGFEIAKLLEHHKVDYLGVAFADEGIALKTAGIKLPIMVLNPETSSFSSIIQYQLEPEIYSLKGLESFIKIAENRSINHFPIHIKIDTGMHRLGFEEEDIPALLSILKATKSVKVKSILSHMATSDDPHHRNFSIAQIELFDKLSLRLMSDLKIISIRHILNTSGISNFPQGQFDMVRLGIGLYGISNDAEEIKCLENVSKLRSVISQIRIIESGESVGYGRRFVATKTTKVATIPVGYADGISRQWGNGVGYVTIHDQKAIILGSICMDMLMVDVSNIDCIEGDSVVIFGENPSVSLIANKLNTIPYEILTGISQRVKRVFYRN